MYTSVQSVQAVAGVREKSIDKGQDWRGAADAASQ
jgi:hypothetical protein